MKIYSISTSKNEGTDIYSVIHATHESGERTLITTHLRNLPDTTIEEQWRNHTDPTIWAAFGDTYPATSRLVDTPLVPAIKGTADVAGRVPHLEFSIDTERGGFSFTEGGTPQELMKEFSEQLTPSMGVPFELPPSVESADWLGERAERVWKEGLIEEVMILPEVQEDVAVSALVGSEEYIRPNGQTYYSRTWGDHTDVEVLRAAREKQDFILLYSAPGTGKTALAESAYGEELITVLGTSETEVADLVGSYVPDPSAKVGFRWVDGPLLIAALEGRPILLDEIGLIDPKVLSVVYSLMDGRRELNVTANLERGVVKAQPGFFVIGATNPNAPGVRMSEALMSRFSLKAEVTTDYDRLVESFGLSKDMARVFRNLATKQTEGDISWAPQFREVEVFLDMSERYGTQFAVSNMLAGVPEDDLFEVCKALSLATSVQMRPARIV